MGSKESNQTNQLSMKFQLLIKTNIVPNKKVSCFKSLSWVQHNNIEPDCFAYVPVSGYHIYFLFHSAVLECYMLVS